MPLAYNKHPHEKPPPCGGGEIHSYLREGGLLFCKPSGILTVCVQPGLLRSY